MAKQKKTQQYCLKLHSSFLAQYDWDLTISIEEARQQTGMLISLADSQILTWINELNGTENYDDIAKEIRHKIKMLKKQKPTKEIKNQISDLYKQLYQVQFREDYISVVMDKPKDYLRANEGFKVNGIEYKRLLTTTNGVKTQTVEYTSARLREPLRQRIDNGRNPNIKLVPAKLGAYEALCASASIPVSWPQGVIVVPDVMTEFIADRINIDDSDITKEPVVTPEYNAQCVNNASDGCGMMLPSLSRRWNTELGDKIERTVSGVNLRNAWTKGMVFTFDFIEWAEKNVGSYTIKDVWGHERDVRDAELILTEGQLKLWKCYDSWEHFQEQCEKNHYSFRVAKTAEHELDNVRQLNYQFIQPYEHLSDMDIDELILPTISKISDIQVNDYRKAILYLAGTRLNADNLQYTEPEVRGLMANPSLINDPHIYHRINKMIARRIQDAKIGVLDVHGNFQILSGDLVALCQSMFEQPVTGVLKSGEIYSQFWIDKGVNEVSCYRAPMSNAHSIQTKKINSTEEAKYWFRYIETCVLVNAWDTMAAALNGFDFDGDLLFTTDNEVLLRNHKSLPALNCIQYNAEKKICTEEDVIQSNIKGFGSKIGQVTNRITSMTSMMSNYAPDSEEYKVLYYRIQCGQAQQQAEIDKAKGIVSNPMPKGWYDSHANRIMDTDSAEEIKRKTLYQKLCASKKPYFFIYNYPTEMQSYKQHRDKYELRAWQFWQMSLQDLLQVSNRTSEQENFINAYLKYLPVDISMSTMNKICFRIEELADGLKVQQANTTFDPTILKSGHQYDINTKHQIEKIYQQYKKNIKALVLGYCEDRSVEDDIEYFDNKEMIIDLFAEQCRIACPNDVMLCDILIDMCYYSRNQKELVWAVCGDTIVSNLLKHTGGNLTYPEQVESDGDFEYDGKQFAMKTVLVGDEDNE